MLSSMRMTLLVYTMYHGAIFIKDTYSIFDIKDATSILNKDAINDKDLIIDKDIFNIHVYYIYLSI